MRHQSTIHGLVAIATVVTLIQCAPKHKSEEKTCVGAQALTPTGIRGASMPAKTLALTFDDGPGMRTRALSQYLKEQGIQAAFFINGRQMGPDAGLVLQQLVEDGHLVANHTETHQSLTGITTATPRPTDAVAIEELTSTDLKIAPFIPSKRYLFRPPFGDYDAQVDAALQGSDMKKYVGPILWDVGDRMDAANGYAADWDCWQDGSDLVRLTKEQCGDLYITQIKRSGRGIVLMHDPYFDDLNPNLEGTVDMVMYMVPILKDLGYTFMRVDSVPDIAAALPPLDGTTAPPDEQAPDDSQPATETSPTEPPPADNPCP